MNLTVVICHFRRDLGWLDKLTVPYIVYNKNPDNNHKFKHNLPNFGFDTIAYLTYIVEHYHNLPDYVCFAQDYPFDHTNETGHDFIDIVNNFTSMHPLPAFFPLGLCYYRDSTPDFCHLNWTLDFVKQNNIEIKLPLKFISSAQCIVSKHLILKQSLEFYNKLLGVFPTYTHLTMTNYAMEYLWPTILGFADELTPINDIVFDNVKYNH